MSVLFAPPKTVLNCLKSIYCVCALLLAFTLGWLALAKVDFIYPVWHDYAGISQAIERYGPQNRYKKGFADTDRHQRIALFAGINYAIHHGGDGLAELSYQVDSVASGPQTLLREPEVVHLQDVAKLIDVLKVVAGLNLLVFLCLASYLIYLRSQVSWLFSISTFFVFSSIIGLVLLIVGPQTVFDQLHIWVFPDEHQWFFYYQESLMSTMMLAPHLFAWIAIVWGLIACALYFAMHVSLTYLAATLLFRKQRP